MNLYLAGTYSRKYVVEELMDFYLGTPHSDSRAVIPESLKADRLYILESFYYVQPWMFPYIDKKIWNFMLDSGAFTFMANKRSDVKSQIASQSINWDDYVRRYADFIIEHDVELFFELDVDVIVGLDRVNKLRDALETRTQRQSIPVWHKSRGLNNWKQLIRDYKYVAIGGIVSGEIRRTDHKFLHAMCDLAHVEKTRVHGLGVTPQKMSVHEYRFDSTDSTSWTIGNRSGLVFHFDGDHMSKRLKPPGTRVKPRDGAVHNFREWVKFQRYMQHAGWRMEP